MIRAASKTGFHSADHLTAQTTTHTGTGIHIKSGWKEVDVVNMRKKGQVNEGNVQQISIIRKGRSRK